ncbi:MAG: hypothetical protein QGG40_07960, partial [Myxococcota bacterium]|nr:hypothetical protein [Myxococcota bacterium]
KKLLLVLVGPPLLVFSVAIGVVWWDRGAPPGFRPPVQDIEIRDLNRDHRGVRLAGTGHYTVRIRQGDDDDESWHLFPLFPEGDLAPGEIRAMIRTQVEPEPYTDFEDIVVEGLARPPGHLVPRSAREALLQRGYVFHERFVLVEAFDED